MNDDSNKTNAISLQLRHYEHTTASVLQTEAEMIKAICPRLREGRMPVQRNMFYEPVKVRDAAPTATGAESRDDGSKSKVLKDNLVTA